MHLVYRPTVEEIVAASREQLRLRGVLTRLRLIGGLLILAAPMGLLLGQWLFALYTLPLGAVLLVSPTGIALRRAARKAPQLHFDTTMDVAEEGVTIVVPTASSRVAWAHYSAWALLPEGLLLVHAMQQRLFGFIPRSALSPELLDLVARHVPRHPRAGRPEPSR